jgi:hypothetical protein
VFFLKTQFKGATDFRSAVADRSIDFRDAHFHERATFAYAHFQMVFFGELPEMVVVGGHLEYSRPLTGSTLIGETSLGDSIPTTGSPTP